MCVCVCVCASVCMRSTTLHHITLHHRELRGCGSSRSTLLKLDPQRLDMQVLAWVYMCVRNSACVWGGKNVRAEWDQQTANTRERQRGSERRRKEGRSERWREGEWASDRESASLWWSERKQVRITQSDLISAWLFPHSCHIYTRIKYYWQEEIKKGWEGTGENQNKWKKEWRKRGLTACAAAANSFFHRLSVCQLFH